jgi:formylglycine-generating enzyme required for sulfatase activity
MLLSRRNSSLLVLFGFVGLCIVTIGATSRQDNKAQLAKEATGILKKYCFQCHGLNGQAIKNIFVLDIARLLKDKIVIPGDEKSSLLEQVVTRAMPMSYDGPAPKLSDAEIETLKKWVAAGAPAVSEEKPEEKRVFLTEKVLIERIEADLNRQNERRRPFLRYYSIAHLYNAGVPDDELEGYRVGLSKLLNSLSWNPEIARPVSIDPQKVLLRIDLSDFDWTPETWKTILSTYPYGVKTTENERVIRLSGAALPYVRADWFVANASVPPLYHDILYVEYRDGQRHEIDNVAELEKKLGVNVARNIEQEKNVVRGGVRNSGVSRNNRVAERHVTGYGGYWRSYDFSQSVGEQNIFLDPLGFKAAGGEMIFHLPNGMQGYFITDAVGKRLEDAPVAIVSDRNYPDEAVVRNGRSCMSCHFGGMKPFKDQVRSTVSALTTTSFDRDKALAIYVEQAEIENWLKRDNERFKRAVEKAGGQVSTNFQTEPINALARKFGAELTVAQAAAEAGLEVKAFQDAVRESSKLAELGFAQLLAEDGGMKRDTWDDYFDDLVAELKLGAYLKPERPIVVARNNPAPMRNPEPGKRQNPKDGAELCFIPAGEFTMGSHDHDREKPVHKVQLSAFSMYKYPVTVAQYEQFCKETNRKMPSEPVYEESNFNPGWSKKDHPIVNVSWDDAMAYCAWASGGRPGSVTLPTEAQWEKAARGGLESKKFPWGEEFDASKLWSSKSKFGDAGGTAPVRRDYGVFENKYGLVDIAGNVWQWCYDYYDENFYGSRQTELPNPKNEAKGKNGYRVMRGGSWGDDGPGSFRCAGRGGGVPEGRGNFVGFRCVVRSDSN